MENILYFLICIFYTSIRAIIKQHTYVHTCIIWNLKSSLRLCKQLVHANFTLLSLLVFFNCPANETVPAIAAVSIAFQHSNPHRAYPSGLPSFNYTCVWSNPSTVDRDTPLYTRTMTYKAFVQLLPNLHRWSLIEPFDILVPLNVQRA